MRLDENPDKRCRRVRWLSSRVISEKLHADPYEKIGYVCWNNIADLGYCWQCEWDDGKTVSELMDEGAEDQPMAPLSLSENRVQQEPRVTADADRAVPSGPSQDPGADGPVAEAAASELFGSELEGAPAWSVERVRTVLRRLEEHCRSLLLPGGASVVEPDDATMLSERLTQPRAEPTAQAQLSLAAELFLMVLRCPAADSAAEPNWKSLAAVLRSCASNGVDYGSFLVRSLVEVDRAVVRLGRRQHPGISSDLDRRCEVARTLDLCHCAAVVSAPTDTVPVARLEEGKWTVERLIRSQFPRPGGVGTAARTQTDRAGARTFERLRVGHHGFGGTVNGDEVELLLHWAVLWDECTRIMEGDSDTVIPPVALEGTSARYILAEGCGTTNVVKDRTLDFLPPVGADPAAVVRFTQAALGGVRDLAFSRQWLGSGDEIRRALCGHAKEMMDTVRLAFFLSTTAPRAVAYGVTDRESRNARLELAFQVAGRMSSEILITHNAPLSIGQWAAGQYGPDILEELKQLRAMQYVEKRLSVICSRCHSVHLLKNGEVRYCQTRSASSPFSPSQERSDALSRATARIGSSQMVYDASRGVNPHIVRQQFRATSVADALRLLHGSEKAAIADISFCFKRFRIHRAQRSCYAVRARDGRTFVSTVLVFGSRASPVANNTLTALRRIFARILLAASSSRTTTVSALLRWQLLGRSRHGWQAWACQSRCTNWENLQSSLSIWACGFASVVA